MITLTQAQEQRTHDPHVGARLAGAFSALPVPLQPTATVDQRAVFFGKAGGRQTNDFGLHVRRIDIVVRPGITPELRRFGGQRVHHHQPLEFAQRSGDTVLVRQGGNRVEALAEVTVDLFLGHHVEHLQHVVTGDIQLRQVVEGPVILSRGISAIPSLHQADMELAVVLPVGHLPRPQRLGSALGNVGVVVLFTIRRQGQVARQQVGQQAQVRQPLNIGVAAQRVDPATRHTNVAQQQLDHRRTADDL
ncbi:hypothetical protein D3C78_891320 [compost metagenome]